MDQPTDRTDHEPTDALPATARERDRLLVLYYAGEISDAERAHAEALLAGSETERRIVDALRDGGGSLTSDPHQIQESFEDVLVRVRGTPLSPRSSIAAHGARETYDTSSQGPWWRGAQRPGTPLRTMLRPTSWHRIVTALVVMIVVGAIGVGMRASYESHENVSPVRRYHTPAGQRATIRWADGSTMVLAPETNVAFTPTNVEVDGEAYFAMTPRATRPFVVRTAHAAVRVLGTRFSVRHYPADSASRIVVDDGKVDVQSNAHQDTTRHTVLTARTMAEVTDSTVAVTRNIDPAQYSVWTHGVLLFNRLPLRSVVQELSRAYNVDIRVIDTTLAAQSVLMEVAITEQPIARVLSMIGDATGSHYTVDGRRYTIVPGHAVTRREQTPPLRRTLSHQETSYGK